MKHFALLLMSVAIIGCGKTTSGSSADSANGDGSGLPRTISGTWYPTYQNSDYSWCDKSNGSWSCQIRSIPSDCNNNWPIINGYSIMGGAISVVNNEYAIAHSVQNVTYANNSVTFTPANVTWGADINSTNTGVYVTYTAGCTLYMERR